MRNLIAALGGVRPGRVEHVGILAACLITTVLSPLHAANTAVRNFVPIDLASVAGAAALSRPIPVAGITLFATQAADGTQQLEFVADPARVVSVDRGDGAGPLLLAHGEIVDVVSADPGAVFDLSNASIEAVPAGNVSRIVVPYFVRNGMHEWGYEKFLLRVAEIDVDHAARSATIVNRAVDLGLDTFPGPTAVLPNAGVPVIVFTFREWNDFVDRDGDGYYGDVIAIHNLATHVTFYTHLKSGGGIFGFVNETECAVNPGTEVDGVQMIAGGANGLVAFTSQEIQFAPANGDVPCDRPGVFYNNDGDANDIAIRYATVADLLNGQGLTLGPIVTDFTDDAVSMGETGPSGFMIGTDGQTVFFAPSSTASFVVHAFDLASGTIANLDASIATSPGASRVERGIASFASTEGGLKFYDKSSDTVVTTNVVLGNGFVPPATDGDTIVFGVTAGTGVDLKMIRLTDLPPPPPPPGDVIEGRMKGEGSVRTTAATARFDFRVREREPGGERAKITLDVNYSEKRRRSDTFTSRVAAAVRFGPDDSVVFSGDGEWNRMPGYSYVAVAADRGEPGRGVDRFEITVTSPSGGTVAAFSGTIQTGNIQALPVRRR